MNIQSYNEACPPSLCGSSSRQLTIRERLDQQKIGLEDQLKRVNEAIAALDAAPETARVLELISKV